VVLPQLEQGLGIACGGFQLSVNRYLSSKRNESDFRGPGRMAGPASELRHLPWHVADSISADPHI
jgi:hypothetical protein